MLQLTIAVEILTGFLEFIIENQGDKSCRTKLITFEKDNIIKNINVELPQIMSNIKKLRL